MRVYLTESQFAKIALTESQESKSISAAKRLLMQQLGYNDDQADKTVRIDIRKKIETLREPAGAKFILGVTRMFANGEGFAAVKLGKKWNFIDRNDNYLTKQWFDLCGQLPLI